MVYFIGGFDTVCFVIMCYDVVMMLALFYSTKLIYMNVCFSGFYTLTVFMKLYSF